MKDRTKIYNILFAVILVLIVSMAIQIGKVEDLNNRFAIVEENHMFGLDSRTYPGNQIDEINDRLDILEEAMWLEGYEHTEYESMPHMNNRLLQEQFRDIMMNTRDIHKLDVLSMPWVSQEGDGAWDNKDDCASASLMMILEYYDINTFESVDDMHLELASGDYVIDYLTLQLFVERKLGLNASVFVTDQALKDGLEKVGYDVSDITVTTKFPNHLPVLWIYSQTPHWVVKFRGYNFDPARGMYPFENTVNIYKPERGLGIIVTLGE